MNFVILKRVSRNEYATYGVLLKSTGEAFAVTLELPWRKNATSISSIPSGLYNCLPHAKRPGTFILQNVPGRSGVLFHVGNQPKDSKGCILVAERFENKGVLLSKEGFAEFTALAKSWGNTFAVKIIEPDMELCL